MQATFAIIRWLLSLFIAVSLGVAASGARAGTLSEVDQTFNVASYDLSSTINGAFTQDFAFTLTRNFGIAGTLNWLDSPSMGYVIGNFSASVRSADGATVFATASEVSNVDGYKQGGFYINALSAGNYLLRLSGDASTVNAFFTGTLSAQEPVGFALTAAPVPEPGAWMLMAAGLGLIGATMRRRGARSL